MEVGGEDSQAKALDGGDSKDLDSGEAILNSGDLPDPVILEVSNDHAETTNNHNACELQNQDNVRTQNEKLDDIVENCDLQGKNLEKPDISDNDRASPDSNSEGSEREILLEPLSAEEESIPVTEPAVPQISAESNIANLETVPSVPQSVADPIVSLPVTESEPDVPLSETDPNFPQSITEQTVSGSVLSPPVSSAEIDSVVKTDSVSPIATLNSAQNVLELDPHSFKTNGDAPASEVESGVVDFDDDSSKEKFLSLNDNPPGPSEDREDISDEELDLGSIGSIEDVSQTSENVPDDVIEKESSVSVEVSMETPNTEDSASTTTLQTITERATVTETLVTNEQNGNDTTGTPSSNDEEIIDLKLEDAVGKSEDSHEDDSNRQSKGPSEDLEAVSDDELPEASHPRGAQGTVSTSIALIEGGEEVSSDEGPASPESAYNMTDQSEVSILDRTANTVNLDSSDISVSCSLTTIAPVTEDSSPQLNPDPTAILPVSNLPPLEAEPISDEEEDIGQEGNDSIGIEDGEAGEIKSPNDIASPASVPDQGVGLLGEVEPISADENSDTDGELPSGDEDSSSRPTTERLKSNFESIDSDEGDLDADISHKQLSSKEPSKPEKSDIEYMETISDEENLDVSETTTSQSSLAQQSSLSVPAEPHRQSSPARKDTEVAPNFNEHQVELDYEENEGEDAEGKVEEGRTEIKMKEDGEEGELADGGGSDKDEGELSDDDCEEGEIKEPGSKKPFVKPMCRFFQRGNCTWGVNCRFLHPGINDKGNYQMIEIPGFKPTGVRARIGVPGQWPEQPEEQIELPPPPVPDVPPVETAWERGLRIAKEQRKKASERKEQEPDFEEKRLNLSVDEERELNKENERTPRSIPKDPYYDQQAFEEDEYYKIPQDPWQTGHYENFEVRYNRDNSYSPPYREKPPMMPPPPARYSRPYSPPVDKFGRDRVERREPFRQEPVPPPHDYQSQAKRPDEWTDPWRRSKSPPKQKIKTRSRSRGRRHRRSVSNSSNSSRSGSGSSSGSSRSSRSFSGSSGSSSRSRSPEPAPPGVDRHDRYGNMSPSRNNDSREQPRSAVSVRGRGDYNNYDSGYRRGGRGYDRGYGGYQSRGGYRGGRGGGGGGYYNNYGGVGGYPDRDMRDRGRDDRMGRNRPRSPPDRPLPYVRPRPKSASSRSSSSRSRSKSRGRSSSSRSRSRSSSGSSRSSSSSSSSAGSADSEHLYRDLGSPSKNPRGPAKKKRTSHKDRSGAKGPPIPGQPGSRQGPPSHAPMNLDRIPHPRGSKQPSPGPPSGRQESKYASRNAPQAPIKAKDPLKVVGQKSNIKLTLLPKQQQSTLGSRPNPLDSPPHNKRRLSERDTSPSMAPPAKRLNIPVPQASALRIATEKAAKIQLRQDKGKSPPPASVPQASSSLTSSSVPRTKAPVSPQKQPSGVKSRAAEPSVAKVAPKMPSASAPTATATGAKAKKSMSSRREELLKQLKAVEDAIARKKSKFQ